MLLGTDLAALIGSLGAVCPWEDGQLLCHVTEPPLQVQVCMLSVYLALSQVPLFSAFAQSQG